MFMADLRDRIEYGANIAPILVLVEWVMAALPEGRHVRPPLRSSKAAFAPQVASCKNDYGTVLRLER
jgi:hypothetical protein